MKNIYVKDLKEGMSLFDEQFAVKSFRKLLTKNDKPYFDLELSDNTGNVRAKAWSDNVTNCHQPEDGEIIAVDGVVELYNDSPQIRLLKTSKVDSFNPNDFIITSKQDIKKMVDQLKKAIKDIKNPHLKTLLSNIFDEDFIREFSEGSASYRLHHAYRAGLLEHTIEMLDLAEGLKKTYKKLNFDLLVCGILLHDIGKIVEYKSGTAITITTKGKLLGHIFISAEYIKSKAGKMPEPLLDEVLHLVLSHHGELEFGSPVLPKTTEAIALAALDNASAKINAAYYAIHENNEDAEFTAYYKHLKTELYRSPYLDNLTNEDTPF